MRQQKIINKLFWENSVTLPFSQFVWLLSFLFVLSDCLIYAPLYVCIDPSACLSTYLFIFVHLFSLSFCLFVFLAVLFLSETNILAYIAAFFVKYTTLTLGWREAFKKMNTMLWPQMSTLWPTVTDNDREVQLVK